MFGRKNYDLRYKDMIWFFRDSFIGATSTDPKDVVQMKKRLARNMLGIFCLTLLLAFFFWLFS